MESVQPLSKQRQLLQQLKETREKCQKTLDEMSQTIALSGRVQQICRQTEDKISQFYRDFDTALSGLTDKIGEDMKRNSNSFKLKPVENDCVVPKDIDLKEAAQIISTKKNVVILSGAGISAGSGIPTFRGAGGFWTRGGDTFAAQQVATFAFYQNTPELYWLWHQEFIEIMDQCKPNAGHTALANLQVEYKTNEALLASKQQLTFLTQNIDGYHIQALREQFQKRKINYNKDYLDPKNQNSGLSEDIFEIHGNMNYFRCTQCLSNQPMYPRVKQTEFQVPLCPKCGENTTRPHVLFFDEHYSQEFYRISTINQQIQDMDCLLVIGSTLETGFALRTVDNALQNSNVLVIEINPEPVILRGTSLKISKKSEEVLPLLCDFIMKEHSIQSKANTNKDPTLKMVNQNLIRDEINKAPPSLQKINNKNVRTHSNVTSRLPQTIMNIAKKNTTTVNAGINVPSQNSLIQESMNPIKDPQTSLKAKVVPNPKK